MSTTTTTMITAVGAVLALAACAPPATAMGTGDDLWGRSFVSQRLIPDDTILADTAVTMSFENDHTLSARADCNTLFGRVEVTGGRLVLPDEGLAGTRIGCTADAENRDAWLGEFLAAEPTIHLRDDTLRLVDGDTELVLTVED